jgi:pumilio homology domain family member 6
MYDRFNNSDKGAVTHAVVHRALWEYLSAVNDVEDEVEQEKLRRDMFERRVHPQYMTKLTDGLYSCQDVLAEMVHTRDGSRVVREFLAQGTAKVCFIAACGVLFRN